MFVSLRRTQTWRLHTKLCKFGWHTPANNSRMKNSRDLILGEVVYISVIYRITILDFIHWMVTILVLIAWLVKTENTQFTISFGDMMLKAILSTELFFFIVEYVLLTKRMAKMAGYFCVITDQDGVEANKHTHKKIPLTWPNKLG